MDAATGLLYQALATAAQASPAARLAVLNAVADPALLALARDARLDLVQTFRPDAAALEKDGMPRVESLHGSFTAIAIRPSKNKLQTLGWIAGAIQHLEENGVLLLAAENSHGAKSYEKLLAGIGPLASTSKAKCRLLRLRKTAGIDLTGLAAWQHAAAPRRQPAHGLWSAPGLFSWEQADVGSALLLEHLAGRLDGHGMDLCCGYGFLGCNLLETHPEIGMLHMLDAEQLALSMARRNAEAFADKVQLHWLDAAHEAIPEGLDWLVCNPPFHSGQTRDIELGQTIVANGCQSLKRGGRMIMVANRKLPYEKLLAGHLQDVRIVIQSQGYKVIEGNR